MLYLSPLFSTHRLRVLEASIAENKACLKRTPTEVWRDSRNPYDRKRQDKAPVGLKNVGNTCWFSAVIQVRIFMQVLSGGTGSSEKWVGVLFLFSCYIYTYTQTDRQTDTHTHTANKVLICLPTNLVWRLQYYPLYFFLHSQYGLFMIKHCQCLIQN